MKWPDWTGRRTPPADALYRRVVVLARSPDWYQRGAVPDTLDGRFDVVALITALVLRRLEAEDDRQFPVDLTERFIADMDGSLRQMGIGDPTVGKQVGHMVSALGGRLGAYRAGLAGEAPLAEALERNLYRGATDADALAWSEAEVRALAARIDKTPLAALKEGRL